VSHYLQEPQNPFSEALSGRNCCSLESEQVSWPLIRTVSTLGLPANRRCKKLLRCKNVEIIYDIPLLVPSSPRITFIAEMTCSTAGGDMDVA
jgi:hypothetical protein